MNRVACYRRAGAGAARILTVRRRIRVVRVPGASAAAVGYRRTLHDARPHRPRRRQAALLRPESL